MDGRVAFVFCLSTFMFLNVAIVSSDSLETTQLKFGNELPTRYFRMFVGISFGLCKHACRSRKKCRAIQYARHPHLCMLMSNDSHNTALERNPKYVVTEKRLWTEPSLSALCDGCSDKEVCELNGSTHSCTIQECPITSRMGIGSLTGNRMDTGAKVLIERDCYSMSEGQRSNVRVYYTCLANGTWNASQEIDCRLSYEDYINYEGCVHHSWRTMLNQGVSTHRNLEKCAVYCFNCKHVYFGIQNGRICYCGTVLNYYLVESTGCNTPCSKESSVTCSGNRNMQLYTYI